MCPPSGEIIMNLFSPFLEMVNGSRIKKKKSNGAFEKKQQNFKNSIFLAINS